MEKKERVKATASKITLTRARKGIEEAKVSAIFALQTAERSLRELPAGATIGEAGEKLAFRITALTLAIEELDRASDNLQRAIESF